MQSQIVERVTSSDQFSPFPKAKTQQVDPIQRRIHPVQTKKDFHLHAEGIKQIKNTVATKKSQQFPRCKVNPWDVSQKSLQQKTPNKNAPQGAADEKMAEPCAWWCASSHQIPRPLQTFLPYRLSSPISLVKKSLNFLVLAFF